MCSKISFKKNTPEQSGKCPEERHVDYHSKNLNCWHYPDCIQTFETFGRYTATTFWTCLHVKMRSHAGMWRLFLWKPRQKKLLNWETQEGSSWTFGCSGRSLICYQATNSIKSATTRKVFATGMKPTINVTAFFGADEFMVHTIGRNRNRQTDTVGVKWDSLRESCFNGNEFINKRNSDVRMSARF